MSNTQTRSNSPRAAWQKPVLRRLATDLAEGGGGQPLNADGLTKSS